MTLLLSSVSGVLPFIHELLSWVQGELSTVHEVLTSLAGVLVLLAKFFSHFSWKLTQRLQREAKRLAEIDKISPYHRNDIDNTQNEVKTVSPAEEIAYSAVRNCVSEKICWLLFASETNDMPAKKGNWGFTFPSLNIALISSFLIIFPSAAVAEMVEKPNDTKIKLTAYVFTVAWFVFVLLFSLLFWRAIRKDFFRKQIHPSFTGLSDASTTKIKSVMETSKTNFENIYGNKTVGVFNFIAWVLTFLFALAFGRFFYSGQKPWLIASFLLLASVLITPLVRWVYFKLAHQICLKRKKKDVVSGK